MGLHNAEAVLGLTPDDWKKKLDDASQHPEKLEDILAEMKKEMGQEDSWLKLNPSPGGLLSGLLDFFSGKDDDLEHLTKRIKSEIYREHMLRERFRTWLPGEDWEDRVFAYVKDFAGEIKPDEAGVHFEGFSKYQGIVWSEHPETYIFYINDRFPGRDPANFHVQFQPEEGNIVIKRVYRMELPRAKGTSAARAILKEMVEELIPDLSVVRKLVVDNAANSETRKALMVPDPIKSTGYKINNNADPAKTPLGHLMLKLAKELGMEPGEFEFYIMTFGLLRIELNVKLKQE